MNRPESEGWTARKKGPRSPHVGRQATPCHLKGQCRELAKKFLSYCHTDHYLFVILIFLQYYRDTSDLLERVNDMRRMIYLLVSFYSCVELLAGFIDAGEELFDRRRYQGVIFALALQFFLTSVKYKGPKS
jgi:hypothetical protein